MTATAHKNVLVVDDEPIICQALKMILRFDGHTAETASSVKEAMSAIDSHSYDIVFLDYQMPEATGDKVARVMKTKHPGSPIIFVTGHIPRPNSPDVDLVIQKPFSVEDIRSAITQLT